VTLRAHYLKRDDYLKRDHSQNSDRLQWESVPQEPHRIAQKDFAVFPRIALMNLNSSSQTSMHRAGHDPTGLGADNDAPLGDLEPPCPEPNPQPGVTDKGQ